MSRYSRKVNTTLSGDNLDDFEKTYLLDAEHEIKIEQEDRNFPVFFQLKILKQKSNIYYTLSLFFWSNEEQKNVAIEDSCLKDVKINNHIENIALEYEPILNKFVQILVSINYLDQLKELMYRMENTTYVFHYKLLNMFTQDELEEICTLFCHHTKINTALLKVQANISWQGSLFLPNYCNGFYAKGMEISTDLSEDDYPTIDYDSADENSSPTKQEILKFLGVNTNIKT